MADIIKVNTVTLKNDTEDIKTRLSNISQKVQSMKEDVKELNSMWEGVANKKFNRVFLEDIQSLAELCDQLNGIVSFETNAKTKYDKCENTVGTYVDQMKI